MKDRRTGLRSASRRLAKLGGGGLLSLVAAEAALTGGLQVASSLRRRLQGEPEAGFPHGDWPEIELESGDGRLKLYSDYEGLYEAMLEEIGRAEERVFVETFIFKGDDVGRRFVDALAEKAREGVEVYVVYDALASLSTSPELFPEGVHALPYRPISGPKILLDPYNCVRDHRKILAVDGRVAFLGGSTSGRSTAPAGGTHTCGSWAVWSTTWRMPSRACGTGAAPGTSPRYRSPRGSVTGTRRPSCA